MQKKSVEEFRSEVKAIRELGRKLNLGEKTIDECFEEVFSSSDTSVQSHQNSFILFLSDIFRSVVSFITLLLEIVLVLVIIYTVASFHNPTQKLIMRHSQNLIYPLMRSVRLSTLHLITKYDAITEWHEEECLVTNPFYQEPSLDCWPCENIRTLVDLTGLRNYSRAYCSNEKPFIVKDVMEANVTLDLLRELYHKYHEELEKGTASYTSNNPKLNSLQNLFKNNADTVEALKNVDLHILWKVNRVQAAQVIRKIFKRPYFVPNSSEVALQKFLYIDGSESLPYSLPITDFADVWVVQAQGSRILMLDPSGPCSQNCSTTSVFLNPGNILYYNWQFWRPYSLPSRLSKDPSITFVGSFY